MIREFNAPTRLRAVEPGWVETLRSSRPDTTGPTRLEPSGELEFVVARRYEATRGQLFAALTETARLRRWLGVGQRWRLETCELDLRVGGAWRMLWSGPLGQQIGARGLCRDVLRPQSATFTMHVVAPWGEHEGLLSADLSDSRGGTALVVTAGFATRARRDGALLSPLSGALAHSLGRLAPVVADEL
jgi:uncharacterized protein YndB with AHSA1/START domain